MATGDLSVRLEGYHMSRERNEAGEYVEKVTPARVLGVFEDAEVPVLTASEVGEQLDCSRSAAYNKLETLVEDRKLAKKTVGARAVVYISMEL